MQLRGPLTTLFWLSVVGLYVEVLLIRWIGTEVRIFAYLQNMILVVCFLGLGAGLFTSKAPVDVRRMLGALAGLVVVLLVPATRGAFANISEGFSVLGGINIWAAQDTTSIGTLVLLVSASTVATLVLLVGLIEVFVPLGRALGRAFDDAPTPLTAYSVNVAGSLVGTLLFVAVSVLSLPPWVWFVGLAVLLAPAIRRDVVVGALVAVLALAPLGAATLERGGETVWSPYQKLVLARGDGATRQGESWTIFVNNTGYQGMFDLSAANVAAHPEKFPPAQAGLSQYDLPLLLHPSPDDVLIVGAGSGNDVAGALRHDVKHVAAVEIDPAILAFGRRLHPERPYDDPRVAVVNDDARSFFATTDRRFDVIVFGLLDSHTTTSMTNARLDHYVYTEESLARVKQLLKPGGVVVLSFEAFKPFLRDRIYGQLRDTFGAPPLAFRVPTTPYGWGGVLFVTGDPAVIQSRLAADPRLAAQIEAWRAETPLELTGTTTPATDDWPYLYLDHPSIPPIYALLAAVALVLVGYLRLAFGIREGLDPRRWAASDWHFALMGSAFLLLEVQNISKASVVLGNTWSVNAVIISGVLVMVLLANALTPRVAAVPTLTIYGALGVVIAGLFVVDLASFAFLPYPLKATVVGGLTTLPMLFSGVIFARSFAATDARDRALGANLLGSLFGALLQTISFVAGIKALLILVALLYAGSAVFRPRDP